MLDPETQNLMALEDRHQEKEERELKNRLLSMTNIEKKQELWRHYFPVTNYQETDLIF